MNLTRNCWFCGLLGVDFVVDGGAGSFVNGNVFCKSGTWTLGFSSFAIGGSFAIDGSFGKIALSSIWNIYKQ